MAKIDPEYQLNPEEYPTATVRFAVHKDCDANIWYCEAHTYVGDKYVCEKCGQDTSHPVHAVRAYGILIPKP